MVYTSLWKACYLCPGARPHLQAWKVQAEVLCDLAILFILFGMSVGIVREDSPSLLFATFFKFKLKKIASRKQQSTKDWSAARPGSLLEQSTMESTRLYAVEGIDKGLFSSSPRLALGTKHLAMFAP